MTIHTTYALEKHPLFANLPDDVLQQIHAIAQPREYARESVIFEQYDAADSLYLLVRGGVHLIDQTPDGKAIVVEVLGAGAVFGLLAVLGNERFPRRTETICDSLLLAIPADDFRLILAAQPELGARLISLLVRRIHRTQDRLQQMAAERVDQRLARALVTYTRQFARRDGLDFVIDLPLSQRDLAMVTGTTVETVNRTLRRWEDDGLIRVARMQLTILDLDRLTAVAQPHSQP